MTLDARVRTRDGHLAAFDPQRIVRAILDAIVEAGVGDRELAVELGAAVEHFLEVEYGSDARDEPIDVDVIHDWVEKVLMETGHRQIARVYVLGRERRAQVRERLLARDVEASSFASDVPIVEDRGAGGFTNWSKSRIVAVLIEEARLDADAAEEIAELVEARVSSSGIARISTTLIRELVDNELFERGYTTCLRRQASVAIPKYDLEGLLFRGGDPGRGWFPGDPRNVSQLIGERILRQYTMEATYSEDTRAAFAEGAIHLHDLDRSLCFAAVPIFAERLEVERLTADREHASGLFDRLFGAIADLSGGVVDEIAVFHLPEAIARAVRGGDHGETSDDRSSAVAREWVSGLEAYRRIGESGRRPQIVFHIPFRPVFIEVASKTPDLFSDTTDDELEECGLFAIACLARALSTERGRRAFGDASLKIEVRAQTFGDRRFKAALLGVLSAVPREIPIAFDIVEMTTDIPSTVSGGSSPPGAGRPLSGFPKRSTEEALPRPMSSVPRVIAGKVTLNLPRVARELIASCGRGGVDSATAQRRWLAAVGIARQALRERATFLNRMLRHPDGPLANLDRWAELIEPPAGDLEISGEQPAPRYSLALGLLGLDDAVRTLIGEGLDAGPVARAAGLEIVATLAGGLRAGVVDGDPDVVLEETSNHGPLRRFQALDRERSSRPSTDSDRVGPRSRLPVDRGVARGGETHAESSDAVGEYASGVRFARHAPIDPLESWFLTREYGPLVRLSDRLDEAARLRAEGPEVLMAFLEEICTSRSDAMDQPSSYARTAGR